MYATLGDDIVFELVKMPDALSDKRKTNYAQIPLVDGKPNLQGASEALIEVSMSIKFHVAFCVPEDEFNKLDAARKNRNILPFIFSNGRNEGNYVITEIERNISQTDGEGNFIEINCNVALLEFANVNTAAKQLEQDRKNAFAVSSNRPLPANSNTTPTNPALNVCQQNNAAQAAANDIDDRTTKVESAVNLVKDVNPSTQLINQAQKFVDSSGVYIRKVGEQVTKANNALGSISSLIGTYSSITGQSPTITTKITAVQTSLTAVNTQLTVIGSLPATISNTTDANTALAAMNNTAVAVKTLIDNSKALDDAAVPLAKAVALKTVLT